MPSHCNPWSWCITISGWLQKKSTKGFRRNWHPRYFRIEVPEDDDNDDDNDAYPILKWAKNPR